MDFVEGAGNRLREALQRARKLGRKKSSSDPAEAAMNAAELLLGRHGVKTERVPISLARDNIAGLLRAADMSHAFLIRNTKQPGSGPKLLIDPLALAQILSAPRSAQTLGDVVQNLPFRDLGLSGLEAKLPFDYIPVLNFKGEEGR